MKTIVYKWHFALLILTSIVAAGTFSSSALAQSGTTPCNDKACKTSTISLNTGWDPATAALYPLGSQDVYWELISSPDPNVTVPEPAYAIPPNAAWTTMPNSEWISPYSYAGWASNNPIIPYVFQRCFCVCDPQAVIHLHFQMLVDNDDSVFFDGHFIATTGMTNSVHNFQIPMTVDTTFVVVAGSHCLDFNVHNLSGVAMGLDVIGTVTSLTGTTFISDTCCQPYGSICGRKIWDKNCNGKDDNPPGNPNVEPGLSGWTFSLNPGAHLATTDTNGYFCFDAIAPGTYTVTELGHPGWHQSFPAATLDTVQVILGQVTQIEFGNCKDTITDCSQYIGKGTLDSSCCQYSFPISSGIGTISKLKYVISGGTIVSVGTAPCTPSSTVPATLFGTTSGTLNYSPPCSSGLNISVQAAPNTASGNICIQWTAIYNQNGAIDSCTFTTCYTCERMAQSRCDSISFSPFGDPNNTLDWRRFTIWNKKLPVSPISKILVALSPTPCTTSWQGGHYIAGTPFDGDTACGGVRNTGAPYFGYTQHYLPVANDWFRTPYTVVPNAVVTSLNENLWAQFDIGVDYTCTPPWVGTVTFTVIHCDGDTCILNYGPWTASAPTPPCPGCQTIGTLSIAPAKLFAWRFQVINPKTSPLVKYLTLQTGSESDVIFAGSGTSLPGQMDTAAEPIADYTQGQRSCLFTFDRPIGGSLSSGYINIVIAHDSTVQAPPVVRWITYDSMGTPLFTDSTVFKGGTSVVGSSMHLGGPAGLQILSISPNPASGPVIVSYENSQASSVQIQIYNDLGQQMKSVDAGYSAAGMHSATFDVGTLPAGNYFCRIAADNGVTTVPFTIVK